MIKTILLSLICLLPALYSVGQTQNQKTLQNAIKMYNDFRDESNKFINPITDEQFSSLENKGKTINKRLDSIQSPDNDEMRKVISYFKLNTDYLVAFNYGKVGKLKKCYSLLQVLEPSFAAYKNEMFPLSYSFFGKNFIIKYENFEYYLHEYYASMTELSYSQSTDNETIRVGRKSESFNHDNYYLRLITQYYMLKSKKRQSIIDKETADLSILIIESYSKLSAENKQAAETSKIDALKLGWENLLSILETNSVPIDKVAYTQRAASALTKAESNLYAVKAYNLAINYGSVNQDFLFEAGEFGVKNDKMVGVMAADKLMKITSETNCSVWTSIGSLYARLSESNKSAQAYKRAENCQKTAQRKANRSNQNIHLYLATYPVRYFTKPEKMDYSGVVGILAGKTMFNFSFIQVKQKKYNFADLWLREKESTDENWKPKWDGIQADFSIRFCQERFSRSGSYSYVGPKFGYARKALTQVESGVTDAMGNYSVQVFKPIDEQLQLMIETGVIAYGKVFGIDLNMSVGAYYGTFSSGNDNFKIEEATFDNILLNNETKKHWAPILRINMTLGLML